VLPQSVAKFASRLLEEEQTVVTEGGAFGSEGYVRMSYATSMDQLREGVKRMKRFAEKCLSE
jgi:aspartate/methionine/tyrosine aminotransferase